MKGPIYDLIRSTVSHIFSCQNTTNTVKSEIDLNIPSGLSSKRFSDIKFVFFCRLGKVKCRYFITVKQYSYVILLNCTTTDTLLI